MKERLGHSSINVTYDRYGHLCPSLEDALTDRLEAIYGESSESVRSRLGHGAHSDPAEADPSNQETLGLQGFSRARGRTRTDDLTLTRRLLWPTELLGQGGVSPRRTFDVRQTIPPQPAAAAAAGAERDLAPRGARDRGSGRYLVNTCHWHANLVPNLAALPPSMAEGS